MTNDRIQIILNRLEKMEVKLNPDPVPLGPAYIHETLVACSDYLYEVSRYLVDIFKEEMNLQKKLNIMTSSYDFELREKLANDPDVRKQKASSDRDAVARNLLKHMEKEINQIKLDLLDLEQLKRIVDQKNGDLKRTNSDIRLQHRTIQSAIQLGVEWPDTDEVNYHDVTVPKKAKIKAVDEVEEGVFEALEAQKPKEDTSGGPEKEEDLAKLLAIADLDLPVAVPAIAAEPTRTQTLKVELKVEKKEKKAKKEDSKIQLTKEVHDEDVFNVEDILNEIEAH